MLVRDNLFVLFGERPANKTFARYMEVSSALLEERGGYDVIDGMDRLADGYHSQRSMPSTDQPIACLPADL